MASSPTARDRSRLAVAAVSGLTAISALAATGWVAGTAAQTTDAQQGTGQTTGQTTGQAAGKTAAQARHHVRPAHPRPVVLKQRPQRTHTTVRYVQGAPSAPVGSGGTVSQPVSQPAPAPVWHPAPAPAPAPAPQPASQPAPSSGS